MLKKSIRSEALKREDDFGGLIGLGTGRGLFMTSAMLGGCFNSQVEGVGGWMARCAIFGRPWAANCVLMDSPRAFFLELSSDNCGGGSELCVVWTMVAGSRGIEGASAAPALSSIGVGIVGLSGRGVLLHLLPCL